MVARVRPLVLPWFTERLRAAQEEARADGYRDGFVDGSNHGRFVLASVGFVLGASAGAAIVATFIRLGAQS